MTDLLPSSDRRREQGRNFICCTLALLTCAFYGSAMGADASGNYAIWGLGSQSCNQFKRSATDDVQRQSYRAYLMGYLTAYNALAEETYNGVGEMKLPAAVSWLDSYCDEHRLDSFERAIAQLLTQRYTERQRGAAGGARSWGQPAREPEPGSETPHR